MGFPPLFIFAAASLSSLCSLAQQQSGWPARCSASTAHTPGGRANGQQRSSRAVPSLPPIACKRTCPPLPPPAPPPHNAAADFPTRIAGEVKGLECEGYVLRKWEKRIDNYIKYMTVAGKKVSGRPLRKLRMDLGVGGPAAMGLRGGGKGRRVEASGNGMGLGTLSHVRCALAWHFVCWGSSCPASLRSWAPGTGA